MARFADVGGCPVPTGYEMPLAVRYVAKKVGRDPTTVYRGSQRDALAILHRHGKHSQGELVAAARAGRGAEFGIRGTPNPEGASTHDLHKGGAFPGDPTDPIPDFKVGMDWPDEVVAAVKAAFDELHMDCFSPYPGSLNERQHVCCRQPPVFTSAQRIFVDPLQPGEHGTVARDVQIYMVRGGFLPASFPIARKVGTYGKAEVAAVKSFQRRLHDAGHHEIPVDGVVGPATFAAMQRRYGWRVWKGVLARRIAAARNQKKGKR